MADTQSAPAVATDGNSAVPESEQSLDDATQGFLGLLEPETADPEPEEDAPTEVDESEDESTEEEESEAEGEAKADDDDEADEEVDEEPDEELFIVKVDGEEFEVNQAELLAGYSRNSSFTKKSMALADDRKAFEAETNQVNTERQAIQGERQQMYAALENMLQAQAGNFEKFQNIDWDKLHQEDPVEWMTKREELREVQEKVQTAKAQQGQLAANFQAEQQRTYGEYLEREKVLLREKMPEYFDPNVQGELSSKLTDYASSQGWSQEDIESLVDHRNFLMLHKAMLYDELKSADFKSKKVKNKPRVARPGKGVDKKEVTKKQRTDSLERLRRTGGIKEAANAFEALLS